MLYNTIFDLLMMSTQCSKHVEAYNKTYYKRRFCALSWLIAKIILRCTVSKTSKPPFWYAGFHRSLFRYTIPLIVITSSCTSRPILKCIKTVNVCRDSSVGIATRYGLDGSGIEPRWGSRFCAPVQTVPGAHPASCTMDTGSFPGVKRPGYGVDHPPHLVPRLRKK